jgi:hypothetical protein
MKEKGLSSLKMLVSESPGRMGAWVTPCLCWYHPLLYLPPTALKAVCTISDAESMSQFLDGKQKDANEGVAGLFPPYVEPTSIEIEFFSMKSES